MLWVFLYCTLLNVFYTTEVHRIVSFWQMCMYVCSIRVLVDQCAPLLPLTTACLFHPRTIQPNCMWSKCKDRGLPTWLGVPMTPTSWFVDRMTRDTCTFITQRYLVVKSCCCVCSVPLSLSYDMQTGQLKCRVGRSDDDCLTSCVWQGNATFYCGGLKGHFYECVSVRVWTCLVAQTRLLILETCMMNVPLPWPASLSSNTIQMESFARQNFRELLNFTTKSFAF